MSFSIYIKLWIATVFGKVKIKPKFKHLEYMNENRYILPIEDGGTYKVDGFTLYTYSDYYRITNEGKKAMFGKTELLHTKLVAWLALLISVFSLAFTIYMQLSE